MISNLFDKNIVKILAFFLISPGSKYTRKEIKEKTGMNNVPLDKTLNELMKTDIVKKERNLFILNPAETPEIKGLKNIILADYREKLNSLPLQIFYILFDISDRFSSLKDIKEIFLFGSYAKLIYSEDSDIDIAIIFYKRIRNEKKIEKKINKEIEKIEKKYKKQIEGHFFDESDLKNKKDPLIKDIIRNSRKIV